MTSRMTKRFFISFGGWFLLGSALCAFGQTCPPPVQLSSDLSAASQGAVISLSGVNPLACPEAPMSQTWTGGELIFSDSPESPSRAGKLYQDASLPATGAGNNRLFVYHVNGNSSGRMKFTVLLKNGGSVASTLTLSQRGIAGPSSSYLYVGKLAVQRWLSSTASSPVTVQPGQTVRLDQSFDTLTVAYNYLLHGIWDYNFNQPHVISICALNSTDDPMSCSGLQVLARDTHQRGTFPNADKIYDTSPGTVIDTTNGIQQLPVAGNTPNDSAGVGTDQTDGTPMTLAGNYGVLYHMHLAAKSSDGRNLGFLINPRAGGWGGALFTASGITPGGVFLIPSGSSSLGDNTKAAVEGKYNPGAGATEWLQFMPAGSSSLPVRIVAVPY